MLEVHDATTQQVVFRRLLEATSRPGTRVELGAAPSWLSALAALCDSVVTLADPQGLLAATDWNFLQAVPAEPDQADFVLLRGDLPPPEGFRPQLGSLSEPEYGATILLAGVEPGEQLLQLSGPGIRDRLQVGVQGLHGGWLAAREGWTSAFPTGVDLLLCGRHSLLALPRTTRVTEAS